MKYAIVINGKVEKIFNDDLPLEMVQKNSAAVIVPDDASCEVGFVYSNGVFAPEESPAVTILRQKLTAKIEALNTKYPGLNLAATDSKDEATAKIAASEMTEAEAVYLDMLNRNLAEALA